MRKAVNRFSLACPMVALLLISPFSVAEPTQETTFEPAPVFEDDDLHSKAKRWEQKPAAKAAEQSAAPVAESTAVAPTPARAPGQSVTKTAPAAPAPATSSIQARSESPAASQDPLKDNMPIALLALAAIGGFLMWGKGSQKAAAAAESSPAHAEPSAPASGTGVERYMKTVLGLGSAGETGVSRYLKTVVGAAAGAAETGVARYLKTVAEATPAAGAETGVARYLKNRT